MMKKMKTGKSRNFHGKSYPGRPPPEPLLPHISHGRCEPMFPEVILLGGGPVRGLLSLVFRLGLLVCRRHLQVLHNQHLADIRDLVKLLGVKGLVGLEDAREINQASTILLPLKSHRGSPLVILYEEEKKEKKKKKKREMGYGKV